MPGAKPRKRVFRARRSRAFHFLPRCAHEVKQRFANWQGRSHWGNGTQAAPSKFCGSSRREAAPYVAHDPSRSSSWSSARQISRKLTSGLPLGRKGPAYFPAGRIPDSWSGHSATTGLMRFGRDRRIRCRCFARRASIPTATRPIARGGWSVASISCGAVTRTEHDGSITVLADAFEGHLLNSPTTS